ncbi:WecB/TagA/CpsF family glycosyltransferase [Clostridium formicaceticum]|uniref:N-acetylglucosaminyldiphosphoundecaprenol N-acetyl-beta-D-mannosaminyltransferase n=1 Tax=Clostridium formicaceticum TaxID=1497 RepID=A0AAC9RQU3_9CLOT|nr:WecB/TagA/CpsF family glycosyltransferase [Clostridium formicaceticum]AOY74831.1 glycosyltransferase [Clostridium formicaceticum]ARE89228.1 Putative N-acetylmannosaminyltransferase [Clostridium formicaceticum]
MRNQVKILGVPIDQITEEEAFYRLTSFLEGSTVKKVYTPNPEIIMMAQQDEALFRVLEEADLVLPDGIGLIIASKIKGLGLKERVTGIDTMDKLLTYCGEKGKSIFLLGGKPGTAALACENMKKQYKGIKIAGFYHGYFQGKDEPEIIEEINQANPDILFVCLGAPKQEKWIYKYQHQLNCKLAMGVGGSVDIYAGTAKRAPILFQKLGLEWFYRLAKEPWRIKRMMALPKFLIRVTLKE